MTIKLSGFLNNGKSSTASSSTGGGPAVRYDISNQNLTMNEQENARLNIDAISSEDAFILALIM
jgi:hypothetical protein